jgi:hypothetical protein
MQNITKEDMQLARTVADFNIKRKSKGGAVFMKVPPLDHIGRLNCRCLRTHTHNSVSWVISSSWPCETLSFLSRNYVTWTVDYFFCWVLTCCCCGISSSTTTNATCSSYLFTLSWTDLHLSYCGIESEMINLLEGRISPEIFVRHYWSPNMKQDIERVRKAIDRLTDHMI